MEARGGQEGKMTGVLVGGSGLIGGTLMHYFKTHAPQVDLYAPNSKKMSLREPGDIRLYFRKYRPDFIINCAIAAIDSDPKLAMEVNYFGTVNLARVALALGILGPNERAYLGDDLKDVNVFHPETAL